MLVKFSNDCFSIYTTDNPSVRIKTNEESFDEIISLFFDTTQEKKKTRKIRFE
jgi:hypothetical protein